MNMTETMKTITPFRAPSLALLSNGFPCTDSSSSKHILYLSSPPQGGRRRHRSGTSTPWLLEITFGRKLKMTRTNQPEL